MKISFTKIEAKIFFQNYFPIIHNLISFFTMTKLSSFVS
jgi:hypothetical protein